MTRKLARSVVALAVIATLISSGPAMPQRNTINLDAYGEGVPLVSAPLSFGERPIRSISSLLGAFLISSDDPVVHDLADFALEVAGVFPPGDELFVALLANGAFLGQRAAVREGGEALAAAFIASGSEGALQSQAVWPGRLGGFRSFSPVYARSGGDVYELNSFGVVSPVVLDLDGDGRIRASRGEYQPHPGTARGPFAVFDIDGDGFEDITEWFPRTPARCDAIVTSSPEPRSGRDLVGTVGGWRTGVEHLARFDRNGDGVVTGDERAGLYAWSDCNGNAVAEPGEVLPLAQVGVSWIEIPRSGLVARFGRVDGREGKAWDWWPSYAIANRLPDAGREDAPAGPGAGTCFPWIHELRDFLRLWNEDCAEAEAIERPVFVGNEVLVRAGANIETFEFAAVARGGRLLLGTDLNGTPARPRLIVVHLERDGRVAKVDFVPLPFDQVFQIAFSPCAQLALVLGDLGSKMVIVDVEARHVLPEPGSQLRDIGLRASGVASYHQGFWFTAWALDAEGAVHGERTWTFIRPTPQSQRSRAEARSNDREGRDMTCVGIRGGLSLTGLAAAVGQIRSHYLTGPDAGFVTVGLPEGGEALLSVSFEAGRILREEFDRADAFGGLAAVPGTVVYTALENGRYVFRYFHEGVRREMASSPEPMGYPFLAPDGGAAVAATINRGSRRVRYLVASAETRWRAVPLADVYPGQGKIDTGVFAHRGPDGIAVWPIPRAR